MFTYMTLVHCKLFKRKASMKYIIFYFTEFLKYKIEKPPTVGTPSSTSSLLSSLGDTSSGDLAGGVSGLLWVHLLAGRGLRSTTTSSAATTPSTPSGQPNLSTSIRNILNICTYIYIYIVICTKFNIFVLRADVKLMFLISNSKPFNLKLSVRH